MAKFSGGYAASMMMNVLLMISKAVATVYTVGDSSGWAIGADYSTWATDKTFAVGDTLVFNYASPGHTVDEVSAGDYKSCTAGNAITSDTSGATSITLRTAGPHYFICGAPGHCSGGMKLAVTVGAASGGGGGAPSSSGATATSPPTTTTTTSPAGVATPRSGAVTQASSAAAMSPATAAAMFAVMVVVFKDLVF